MGAQDPASALREMRTETAAFINYLQKDGVIDDATPLFAVRDSLSKPVKRGRGLAWEYRTGRVTLRLEPHGIEWPEQATDLTCTLDASVTGTVMPGTDRKVAQFDWEIHDSSINLEFSAVSKTKGGGWRQYWHFDTHRDEPGKPIPNEAHPLFHLHFGGDAMKARRATESDCWGKCLELKSPRLVHPPLDLILAFDFVLSNAAGFRWRQTYLKDKSYRATVCNAQRRFWRPYQETLANFYGRDRLGQDSHPARVVVPTLHVDEL